MIVIRRFVLFVSALLLASCATPPPQVFSGAQSGPFRLGLDVLAGNGYDLLRGKRIGLITNQTSVTGSGTSTRVAMKRAGVNLVALYAPEHGIDGTVGAGRHFGNQRDSATGLPIYSLYGATRKPTPQMLAGIDMLVFDIQDIGCRSYTYISTMIVSMEACAENGKEFTVLDRPNPLGGLRVEGPSVSPSWKSFVSQVPTPYVHGMTAGELAMMACGEGWVKRPHLHVVKMQGWGRNMVWQDLGLGWRRTSPNIPNGMSPFNYVATGILGGAASVDVGIGWGEPFAYAGGAGVNPQAMAEACRRMGFSDVGFTPYSHGGFGGVKLSYSPRTSASLTALDVYLLAEINRQTRGAAVGRLRGDQLSLFNKVYGSDSLYRDLRRGVPASRIVASWAGFENNFRMRRQRYLLY
ncbi:MAG: DUF1343 domain-containing protein [Verrucomicrobia bacterium]|nr:DUF1343 domain-containing protein [Verrucomicrobiota bacterium]